MVKASLKKVFIKNFKSLHDCEIDIGKMNVVVGGNASGKSNLVEVFRLLKKIYVDKDPFPFLEWWGYNNVVWQKKEELPISIGLLFDIEGYEAYFETNFSGAGGNFQILREVLDIRRHVKFEKKGEWVTIQNNVEFINDVIESPQKYNVSSEGKKIINKQKNDLIKGFKDKWILEEKLLDISKEFQKIKEISTTEYDIVDKKIPKILYEYLGNWEILSPVVHCRKDGHFENIAIYVVAFEIIYYTINKLLILYPLNIRLMKSPQSLRREEALKEDGTNIASVYHSIYLKEGKIPDEIHIPFAMVFPKTNVRPHITDDGRVMIKFFEDGLELLPPNTSDGFYKILTMLIAIYLKPPLLIVDEIENSLHPSTLELILDTIKIGDNQAIITTHSPVVVDMTELNDIILVEKEQGESKFKRIKDPDKIREFLIEKGITFSEGWIYGDLLKTEQ